jgi:hypothetical protein
MFLAPSTSSSSPTRSSTCGDGCHAAVRVARVSLAAWSGLGARPSNSRATGVSRSGNGSWHEREDSADTEPKTSRVRIELTRRLSVSKPPLAILWPTGLRSYQIADLSDTSLQRGFRRRSRRQNRLAAGRALVGIDRLPKWERPAPRAVAAAPLPIVCHDKTVRFSHVSMGRFGRSAQTADDFAER